MAQQPFDIGSQIKNVVGKVPTAQTAATVNGTGVSRMTPGGGVGYESCVVSTHLGASAGTPDSFTVIVTLEDSDAVGGTYATYSTALTTLTAINTSTTKSFDLRGAKEFVRVATVAAFVGGSTPSILNCSNITFGGSVTKPTA